MSNDRSRLENAALIAEVLGGIAVVVSVIYLAMQISDNNRLLCSGARPTTTRSTPSSARSR